MSKIKETPLMKALTLRQIFKTLNDLNNMGEVISHTYKGQELIIYIDEEKFYRGTSYVNFYSRLKEEYVEEFVKEVLNMLWCGTDTQIFTCLNTNHKIELYII